MSAEILRKAASRLRELVDANSAQPPVNIPVEAVWINSRQYLVLTPDFALAVADWLDRTAELINHDVPALEQTALAVARAYLGDPS